MTNNFMTCAECDDLFLDLFEDQLDLSTKASVTAHVSSCARCQGLVRDIHSIRAGAASMPDLSPSRDFWQEVERRIQPSVVSIAAPRRAFAMSRPWLAAAAAALVIVSSSVTYFGTRSAATLRAERDAEPRTSVAQVAASASGGAAVRPTEPQALSRGNPVGSVEGIASSPSQNSNGESVRGRTLSAPPRGAALVSRSPARVRSVSEIALAGEIGRLQTLLSQRRTELEPATVKVLEDNLAIIDAAVAQARSALARDPASGFLNERLEDVLEKKMELLRTVAFLSSST